jgi:uncharacterized protein (DUF362 family)/Pyruvate/2-oxoacid:ferredoxin oxidoreductase delta subunit
MGPIADPCVALVRCAEYGAGRVEAAVRQAVDLLGGVQRFVDPGQRVLVKPNLLLASDPARAAVTHPLVVRAVVRLVQEAGGQVLIADNPFVIPVHRRGWQTLFDRTGLSAVAAETGAVLNTEIVHEQRPHPAGELVKLVDTTRFLTSADVVISLPKLKTHGFMRFSGAVKNLFGTVPGATKSGYHVKLQTVDCFADMLLDLVSFVRPALTVMDAVVGMDGNGPSAGRPFPIGAILAGPDPVAVDVAAVALVGHVPASVPTIARAMRRGWSTGRPADLLVLGEALDALRVDGFHMPAGGRSSMDLVPGFLQRWAARQMVANPRVSERCVGCGLCIEHCPVQTIGWVEGQAKIDLARCIRCYCCHELCPEQAIDLHQPWIARTLARRGW